MNIEEEKFRKAVKELRDSYELHLRGWAERCLQDIEIAYEKEKEKREIAEENHKVLSLDLGKALKELGLYEDTIIADELALEINKRFVSKDRIKQIQIIDLDGIIHNVYRIEEE